MKFFLWILFFLFLSFLPSIYWERLLLFLKDLKVGSQINPRVGEALWQEMLEREVKGHYGPISDQERSFSTRPYKFYREALYEILEIQKNLGATSKEHWRNLRSWLGKDIAFEKEVREKVVGSLLQFASLFFLTHGFIILSSQYLGMGLNFPLMMAVLLWQLIGLLIFLYSIKLMRVSSFRALNLAVKHLVFLSLLLKGRLSVGQVLQRANLNLLLEDPDPKLLFIQARLPQLLEYWKGGGICIAQDLRELIELCWSLNQKNFTFFIRKLDLLKFLISVFFFLSSYFILLSVSFSGFFVE